MEGTVYLFMADGTEEVEALAILDVLRRAKIPVKMVSVSGSDVVESSHGVKIVTDILFDEADFSDAKMIVLPGGMPGSTNLYEHEGLRRLIVEENKKNTALAAICAAPFILGRLGILDGVKATCFPGFEDDLKGALFTGSTVEVDGRILTAKGAGTALPLGYAIVEFFLGKETAERLRETMIFNDLFR